MKKKVQTQVGDIEVKKTHVLAPIKGFRQSPYLQETSLYLGQKEVFSDSSELLERLCGVTLSAKQIENLCHHYGEVLEVQSTDNKEVVFQKESLHYAMVDGSFILSREDGWVETKVGRVFEKKDNFEISPKRTIINGSSYVAHIGGHEAFFDKFSLLLNELSNLVFIADGATWIWKWVSTYRPDAVQVLDFYHAFEKICQWATLVFKDKTRCTDWCNMIKELLLDNQVVEVILRIQEIDCKSDTLNKQQSLVRYIENNSARMMYKTYLQKGYLIGSGAIESAQRTVVQQRLKRSGQRWTKKGAQQVLNIRTACLSNEWENVRTCIRKAA